MKKLNVVFCEANPSLVQSASAFFAGDGEISLHAVTAHAADAYPDAFDVAVVDAEFPSFREAVRICEGKAAKIILTSRQTADDAALPPVTDIVFFKPYSLLEIRSRILKLAGGTPVHVRLQQDKGVDERLSNIFIRAGIPPHIKGYHFLREAVKFAIAQPDLINSITKKLYPAVAESFGTSSSKVERAIRHAIEVAWNRGKIENLNAIFGIKIYGKGDKPTNGELIALLADKLLIESR